jgi:multidrug efflux system membrane fusion protein
MMRMRVLAGAGCLVVVTLVGAACTEKAAESKQAQKRPPVPVAVAPVEQKSMAVQVTAIGTVEAFQQVTVRSQVGGELLRVHIKEGQDLCKGDLLFAIDPRTLEAVVAQAQANLAKDRVQVQQARAALQRDLARVGQARAALARDMAQAKNAEVQAKRYQELLRKELISKEQHDQYQTTAEALAATVQADQADVRSAEETVRADEQAIKSAEEVVRADEAAVDNAKVQLGYTTIRSPIDGRAGSLGLNQGNVVRANDSTLLVINQVQPIYVSFTVPQQQLPAIKRYMAEGSLAVRVLPSGDPRPVGGRVTFIDNAVDPTTGTIRLKATFRNDENRLWPGQFVNVTLTLTTQPEALVIPAQAVQSGQQGTQFVFVVKDDSTVENRRIAVDRTQGNETVVANGLQPGEKVVVDGQPRLTAGAKVEVRAAAAPGEGGPGRRGGAGKAAGGEKGGAGEKLANAEKAADGVRAGGGKKGGGEKAGGEAKAADASKAGDRKRGGGAEKTGGEAKAVEGEKAGGMKTRCGGERSAGEEGVDAARKAVGGKKGGGIVTGEDRVPDLDKAGGPKKRGGRPRAEAQ